MNGSVVLRVPIGIAHEVFSLPNMMFFVPVGALCSVPEVNNFPKEPTQRIRSFDLPAGGINGADRDVLWALLMKKLVVLASWEAWLILVTFLLASSSP